MRIFSVITFVLSKCLLNQLENTQIMVVFVDYRILTNCIAANENNLKFIF